MLEPYLKVLGLLVRVSLREENAKRREELLLRFADSVDEDISHITQSRKKKAAGLPAGKPGEPDGTDQSGT